MSRSYYSRELQEFLRDEDNSIIGELTNNHQFALEELQRNAWQKQIEILKQQFQIFKIRTYHV